MNGDSNISIQPITLSEINGEPRARDVDIGERLGFARPRVVRELIARNMIEIEGFGPLAARHGESRGQPFTESWLNEEQALLISILSNAPRAPAVRAMLIRTFVDWRRGNLAPASVTGPRDVHVAFRSFHSIARLIGFDANESALSANRATIRVTGFNALEAIGATHLIAAKQEELLTPTAIGQRLGGWTPQFVNKRLEALGFQVCAAGSHGPKTWHPTEIGQPHGRWLDTSKRHQDGTSVQQWKWFASIVPQLQNGPPAALVAEAGIPAA